tara:strand:+ start:1195 stop:2394 length:1200 start_codon:yes stop_codon:yes gene_type:complete
MHKSKKIPVVILNGFLGSGKTTLFSSLLSQSKQKNISVYGIVNDMSELDVDGEILGNKAVVEENKNILESISSCVLSSKLGIEKLDQRLHKLLTVKYPDLIVIETSGSCHPMPIIEYLKNHNRVKLTGLLVLIDSLMMANDFSFGSTLIPKMQQNMLQGKRDTVNLLVEQILFSSHLILTKEDRIKKEKLTDISSNINRINPLVSVNSILFGKLSIESLFELEEYNYSNVSQLTKELKPILESEKESNRPYDLATRVIKDDRPFHPERLWNTCHDYLDKRIYRSKGFFWLSSRDRHSLLWNQAGGAINLELIGSWKSGIIEDQNNGLLEVEIKLLREKIKDESGRFGDRHCDLTVIGDKGQIDQFTNKLKSCFLSEYEIKLWESGHKFKDPWPRNLIKI